MQLRITATLMLCVLSLTGVLLLSRNGWGGSSADPRQAASKALQPVLVIFQENRSPDNLFHGLPHADIANSGVNSLGERNTLRPINTGEPI